VPTIGVSIAVPDPWGKQLQEYRLGLGDETAVLIPTHITLLPPYDATADEVRVLEAHLEHTAAATSPFPIHLRGTGTFRPVSPVVFVGVVEGISRCEQLAGAVRHGPVASEVRFPYHPHVTVAHDLEDALLEQAFRDLADFECEFEVEEFWLYVHDPSDGWTPTRAFSLCRTPSS
jgi:2'-5' RNA ligase